MNKEKVNEAIALLEKAMDKSVEREIQDYILQAIAIFKQELKQEPANEKIRALLEDYKTCCMDFARGSHHKGQRPTVKFWQDKAKYIESLLKQEPCSLCGGSEEVPFRVGSGVVSCPKCTESQEPDYSKWKGWDHGMEGIDSANGPIKLASESQEPEAKCKKEGAN